MLKQFYKSVLRDYSRHALVNTIGVLSLAIGITCFTVISYYTDFELSYDTFHEDYESIYTIRGYAPRYDETFAFTPEPMSAEMYKTFPQVSAFSKIGEQSALIETNTLQSREQSIYAVDTNFFDFFGYELLQGESQSALNEPYTIVLTESVAQTFFGQENPMGRIMELDLGNGKLPYKVTGVAKNSVENSHFKFDGLISFSSQKGVRLAPSPWFLTTHSYIKLIPGSDPEDILSSFPEFREQHLKGTPVYDNEISLVRVDDIHLNSSGVTALLNPPGSLRNIRLLLFIATVILLMSGTNYVNLMISGFVRKTRSVGVHKVMGAGLATLVKWVMLETLIFFSTALLLSLVFIELGHSHLVGLTGVSFDISWFNFRVIGFVLGIFGLLVILISIYPVILLKRVMPSDALKGHKTLSTSWFFKKGVSGMQFLISQVLIISLILINQQVDFFKNKDLGFDGDQVLVIKGDGRMPGGHMAFKDALLRIPQVQLVTSSDIVPGKNDFHDLFMGLKTTGDKELSRVKSFTVDVDFLETLDIKLLEGETSLRRLSSDDSTKVLINESLVKHFGLQNTVGEKLKLAGGKTVEIAGVVADFHNKSLHEEVEPSVILPKDPARRPDYFLVKLHGLESGDAVKSITRVWDEFVADKPLESYFLDSYFDGLYKKEEAAQSFFNLITSISILIACAGLFSAASITIVNRMKEVSIRKVLGAKKRGLFYLLCKSFFGAMLIASAMGFPIAYLGVDNWLSDFAYRIDIGADVFVLSFLLLSVMGVLSIAYYAIKITYVKPVSLLRNE